MGLNAGVGGYEEGKILFPTGIPTPSAGHFVETIDLFSLLVNEPRFF
jgi:hypothetical protein